LSFLLEYYTDRSRNVLSINQFYFNTTYLYEVEPAVLTCQIK